MRRRPAGVPLNPRPHYASIKIQALHKRLIFSLGTLTLGREGSEAGQSLPLSEKYEFLRNTCGRRGKYVKNPTKTGENLLSDKAA